MPGLRVSLTFALTALTVLASAGPAGADLASGSPELESGPPTDAQAATRSRRRVAGHPANIVPFTPSPFLRRPSRREVPRFWNDGRSCSTGCRAGGAITGWPLRPFHRQHALRAGINELRTGSMHSGIDIQGRNGQAVYAVQGGVAKVTRQGVDTNVQVGRFVYFHLRPWVRTGQYVSPYSTVLGQILTPAGHVHLTDQLGKTELNPLRPGGRIVAPWHDTAPPVIGMPEFRAGGAVDVRVYDPQSFTVHTTYWTPVLAPAALAYRVYSARGRRRDLAALGPARVARLSVLPPRPCLRARCAGGRMDLLRLPPALHAELALPPRGRPRPPFAAPAPRPVPPHDLRVGLGGQRDGARRAIRRPVARDPVAGALSQGWRRAVIAATLRRDRPIAVAVQRRRPRHIRGSPGRGP